MTASLRFNCSSMLQNYPPSASASMSGSNGDETTTVRIRRKPIPGKGHRKSRRGCYNCKRRRVKCPGGKPECQHCSRIGLACSYPPPPDVRLARPPTPASNINHDHLRFFHHFLVAAHPPLPYGASDVWQKVATWTHEVSRPRPGNSGA